MSRKSKKKALEKIKPKDYLVYGIFDFQKKELIYIHLDEEQVELEFELSDYDQERYDIVEFHIRLL